MIFNLFGSKKQPEPQGQITDYVYAGNQGKTNALITLAKENVNTIFIAWFVDSVTELRKIFIQNNLDENKIMEAKYFHIGALQNATPVFIEHYPILQKELDFLDKFHIQKISVYSSLDEPMFEHFGSGKIKPMIKFLGMKEDEPIVHAMVSKSIAGAQQKIADKIIIDQHANSQKEWLLKNLK